MTEEMVQPGRQMPCPPDGGVRGGAGLDEPPAAAAGARTRSAGPRRGGPWGESHPAAALAELLGDAELVREPDGGAWVRVTGARRPEVWPLRSAGFHRWLSLRLFEMAGKPPSSFEIAAVLNLLEAIAARDGQKHPVFTRKGERQGTVYLDLAGDAGRAVAISAAGWRVLSDPPIWFHRPRGLLPLPAPQRGGSLADLRPFLNTESEDDFRLLATWLLAVLGPHCPCPLLALSGEPGSGKSTAARVLRRLADPSAAALRHDLRGPRDLVQLARNSLVVGLGPLRALPNWLPVSLGCLATGGAFACRRSPAQEEEEITFTGTRPALLTSVGEIVTAPELLPLALRLSLPALPETRLQTETALWTAFEAARPRILGALLDAVAAGMRRLALIPPARLARMADFARWGSAVEAELGWPPGGFAAAYAANRGEAAARTLEPSALAGALLAHVAAGGEWTGSCKELLPLLAERAGEPGRPRGGWPGTPEALAHALRTLAPTLRAAGVAVTFLPRTRVSRPVRLAPCAPMAPPASGRDGPVTVSPLEEGLLSPLSRRAVADVTV